MATKAKKTKARTRVRLYDPKNPVYSFKVTIAHMKKFGTPKVGGREMVTKAELK